MSVFHFADPDFSIGMLDLLMQRSPMAWLLFGLAVTVVYMILSWIPSFRTFGIPDNDAETSGRQ